jgi:hypothetical protein
MLNVPICNSCHAVGGHPYRGTDPTKDIQGPSLDRVQQRLRPDYLTLWLRKPKAFLPYTSMPANFPANQRQSPDLFGADPAWQTQAMADALLNYYKLMERYGMTSHVLPEGQAPAEQPAAPAADQAAAVDAGG